MCSYSAMSRGVVEQYTTERRDVLEKKPLGDQQICLDCTICKYQGPREAYIQYIPIRASVLAFFPEREGIEVMRQRNWGPLPMK